jgi:hypothetical protein
VESETRRTKVRSDLYSAVSAIRPLVSCLCRCGVGPAMGQCPLGTWHTTAKDRLANLNHTSISKWVVSGISGERC